MTHSIINIKEGMMLAGKQLKNESYRIASASTEIKRTSACSHTLYLLWIDWPLWDGRETDQKHQVQVL